MSNKNDYKNNKGISDDNICFYDIFNHIFFYQTAWLNFIIFYTKTLNIIKEQIDKDRDIEIHRISWMYVFSCCLVLAADFSIAFSNVDRIT